MCEVTPGKGYLTHPCMHANAYIHHAHVKQHTNMNPQVPIRSVSVGKSFPVSMLEYPLLLVYLCTHIYGFAMC